MVGRKRGFRKSSIRCWQAAVTADFSAAEKPLDLMCPLGSRRFGTTWRGLSPASSPHEHGDMRNQDEASPGSLCSCGHARLADDGLMPLICPTCQMVSGCVRHRSSATLHGVVFD